MKLKKEEVIKIYWVDQGYYTGPIPAAEKARVLMKGTTVGLFLEQDDESITICAEKFVNVEENVTSYRHILTFPIECVIEITKV